MADKGQLFLERLETPAVSSQAPTVDKGAQVLQQLQTGALLGGSTQGVNAIPAMQRPPQGVERFAREGVPLDVSTGVGFMKRAGLSFQPTDADKLASLRDSYKGATVEQADNNFIIRNVLDQSTGQVKDLLVDEQGMDVNDVADLANVVPELAAELLVFKGLGIAKRTANMGRVMRTLSEAGVAGGASQTMAALNDSLARFSVGTPVEVGEIAGRRATDALSGAALGASLGAVPEALAGTRDVAKGRVTGTLAPGPQEREGIRALNAIEREQGVVIQPTLGQMAQDPNVMRLEEFMSRIPFFGRPFRAALEAQDEAVRTLQRQLVGDAGVTPLNELGTEVADTVRASVRQPQASRQMAEMSIANRAADEVESAIVKMAPSAVRVATEPVVDVVKYTARARQDEFREKSAELFDAVGNPSIPTRHLDAYLKDVEASLPRSKVEVRPDATLEEIASEFEGEVEAFLLDAAGRPMVTTTGQPINRDLVPSSLTKLLRGLRKLGDEVPLDQLRTVRNTVDNAIREGRGLEDLSVKQLKDVSNALTRTVEAGAAELPDKAVGEALKRANKFYRENIEQFEVPVVARLLKRRPDQPGYVGAFSLMDELRGNADTFRAVEGFLKGSIKESGKALGQTGEKSFNLLRRSILEDVYRRASTSPGAGRYIDAKAFEADLASFKPEIRATLLGADERTITRNLDLLKQLKEGFEDVPVEDLNAFLKYPANSVQDLSRLATARQKERALFDNEVVKKLFKGEPVDIFDSSTRADQAVDWLLHAKNESDVTQFMALLGDNPEVVTRLRANTVADFFQEVAQKSRHTDAALRDSTHLVNPSRLIDAVRDPEKARRLRLIVGDENYRVIDNFATAQTLLGKKAGQTLPGTSAAMSILTDVTRLLRNVPDTAKFVIYSRFFTNRTLQRMIREGSLDPATDVRALTRVLVGSPPVLEALGEEYGKPGAQLVIDSIKSTLGSDEEVTP